MLMNITSRLSEICQSMWQLIVPMCGHSRTSLRQMLLVSRLVWQAVRQMNFQKLASFGAILSMTGKLWIRMVMLGGLNACVKASRFTTLFVSTTSAALSLTGKYLLAQKHLLLVSGSKVQTTSFLQRLRKPWVI